MKDEEFVFRQDVKEKAPVSRSARYRRTHNGKSGRVRFPSDNLSRKEVNAMNGEVKSYRLNDPMKWDEFRYMPDDIKVTYIKILRQKFNVPFVYIGNMLGCSQRTISAEVIRLGLSEGKAAKGRSKKWDKEGWVAWCNGAPIPAADPMEEASEAAEETVTVPKVVEADTEGCTVCGEDRKAIPDSGTMTFEGSAESVLNTLSVLLGGAAVHISVTWDVLSAVGGRYEKKATK